jgi:hypothetical protein
MIYYGEEKANVVTLSVSNSDIVDVTCDIPTFEANVGGRWIIHEWPQPFPLPDGRGSDWVGGMMSAGAKREAKLIMPGGTEVCRVRFRYYSDTWKSRFIVRIGPMGQRCVTKSRWLRKLVWPDPFESMRMQPWKSNTVEIMIPRRDRKPGVLLPSAHNQVGPATEAGRFAQRQIERHPLAPVADLALVAT